LALSGLGSEFWRVHDAGVRVGRGRDGGKEALQETVARLAQRGAFEPDGTVAVDRCRVLSARASGFGVICALDHLDDLAVIDHLGLRRGVPPGAAGIAFDTVRIVSFFA